MQISRYTVCVAPDGIYTSNGRGVGIICECTWASVYICLSGDVMALQRARANDSASRHQILKQSLSPGRVATHTAATIYEELGWLIIADKQTGLNYLDWQPPM